MFRHFYRCLLGLHPLAFREQFGAEMLCIFDETVSDGVLFLLSDCVVSLARQWLLRSGAWKMAAGGVLSLLVMGGMLGATAIRPQARRSPLLQPALRCPAPCAPADFRGHWAGNFHWPAPAGQVEVTLSNDGNAWIGEFLVRGPDGIPHRGPAEDLRFEGGAVSFRVRTVYGRVRFNGWMAHGKLTGALEPIDSSSF
jgi:hypothetical protein